MIAVHAAEFELVCSNVMFLKFAVESPGTIDIAERSTNYLLRADILFASL